MRIFESIITVTEKDLDELNHVNNIRYVEWVQEIAKQHWLKKASQDTLENFFWVMTNHCIEYKNEAYILFTSMVTNIRHSVTYLIFRSQPILKV